MTKYILEERIQTAVCKIRRDKGDLWKSSTQELMILATGSRFKVLAEDSQLIIKYGPEITGLVD